MSRRPAFTLVLLLLASAKSAAAQPNVVNVSLVGPDQSAISGRVTAEPVASAVQLRPETFNVGTVGGRVTLHLRPGLWRLTAEATGWWVLPKEVQVGASLPELNIGLRAWPAAKIRVPLRSPPPELRVPVVRLVLRPEGATARDSATEWEAAATCPPVGLAWVCDVPAARLDLQLRPKGFVPVYLWGVVPERGSTTVLAPVALRRGPSISGWVHDRANRPAGGASVALTSPDSATCCAPDDSARSDRVASPPERSNARGFFQLAPAPLGELWLIARLSDLRSVPMRIDLKEPDVEISLLDPLVLQPPASLLVHAQPPFDPSGMPWKVRVRALQPKNRATVIARNAPMSRDGEWQRDGLAAGEYSVALVTRDDAVWREEVITLEPGLREVTLDTNVFRVKGSVSMGRAALGKAKVVLSSGRLKASFSANEQGEFEGDLPFRLDPEASVTAMVTTADPAVEYITMAEVEGDSSEAFVRIRLANGGIEGRVLGPNGMPWQGKASIIVSGLSRDSSPSTQVSMGPSEEGRFRLRGLEPGQYKIEALSAPRLECESLTVDVTSDDPRNIELQLKEPLQISGTVAGAEGLGIAAAEVTAYGSNQTFVRPVFTDAQGRFETQLSPGAVDVVYQVGAPGWALRVGRTTRPHDGGPLNFTLDRPSGRLIVEGVDPRDYFLLHQGAVVPLALLSRWASKNGGGIDKDRAVLPALELGEYRICWGDKPPSTVGTDTDQCRAELVTAGAEVVVRSGAGAAPGKR